MGSKISSSPMSVMKARQKKTLKRSTSCPDVHDIDEIVTAKNESVKDNLHDTSFHSQASKSSNWNHPDNVIDEDEAEQTILQEHQVDGKFQTSSVQTEEFLVSPYEHLFPLVLPQCIDSGASASAQKVQPADNESSGFDLPLNPYDILDEFVTAAYKTKDGEGRKISRSSNDNASVLDQGKKFKDEITLLHNQLLYERHRREILGLRNRRLLGKTKSSRILEEQNTALVRVNSHFVSESCLTLFFFF